MSNAANKVLWPVFPGNQARVVLLRNSERNLAIVIAETRSAGTADLAVLQKAEQFGFSIKETDNGKIAYHPAQEGAFPFRVRALAAAIGADVASLPVRQFEKDFRIVTQQKPRNETVASASEAQMENNPSETSEKPESSSVHITADEEITPVAAVSADDHRPGPEESADSVANEDKDVASEEISLTVGEDAPSDKPVDDEKKESKTDKVKKIIYGDPEISDEIAAILLTVNFAPDPVDEDMLLADDEQHSEMTL